MICPGSFLPITAYIKTQFHNKDVSSDCLYTKGVYSFFMVALINGTFTKLSYASSCETH